MRISIKNSYEALIFAEEIEAALKAAADAYYAANPTEAPEEVCSCCCKGVEQETFTRSHVSVMTQ